MMSFAKKFSKFYSLEILEVLDLSEDWNEDV
jgi:hypothetical protein